MKSLSIHSRFNGNVYKYVLQSEIYIFVFVCDFMVRVVHKNKLVRSSIFLKLVLVVALILFALFAYLLYTYKPLLLSPSGDFNNSSSGFLFWVFIIGMLIALVIVAFVLYYFLHESEHRYPFEYEYNRVH